MDICPICFEEMDMLTFNDPNPSTPTCFKLECSHSFHTKCIISTLQKTNHECPSCNLFKTPKQLIERDGLVKSLIQELKREPEISNLLKEFKEAKDETHGTFKQLEKETKEFVKKRSEELHFEEKRKYAIKAMSVIRTRISVFARAKGPLYIGALSSLDKWSYRATFERKILGLNGSWRCLRIIRWPTLRIPLNNMK
jgi:hypothetical protein